MSCLPTSPRSLAAGNSWAVWTSGASSTTTASDVPVSWSGPRHSSRGQIGEQGSRQSSAASMGTSIGR